jgi:hypothetical protein
MKKESPTNRWLFLTAFLDGLGGCGLYGVRTYRTQSRPSTGLEALRGEKSTIKVNQQSPLAA